MMFDFGDDAQEDFINLLDTKVEELMQNHFDPRDHCLAQDGDELRQLLLVPQPAN